MYAASQRAVLLALLLLPTLTEVAAAQRGPAPQITDVFPTGARAGTALEVKVTGQNLTGIEGLHFSFPGTKVDVLGSSESVAVEVKKRKGNQPTKLQTQRFKVSLPADAPLGIQDVRIVGKGGISNARAFVVGDLQELNEHEPNDDTGT